jgi:hypothetical protein
VLNKHHRESRLRLCYWARRKPREWDKIIFADEKLVEMHRQSRRVVWITKGVNDTDQFGRKGSQKYSCMVWAAARFSVDGDVIVSKLHKLTGKQDSAAYIKRLTKAFQEPIYSGVATGETIYQQDGAGYHRSHESYRWLLPKVHTMITWPARSPDLSPIEFIWGRMERYMADWKHTVKSEQDLSHLVSMAWRAATKPHEMKKYRKTAWANMNKCIQHCGGNKFAE